MSEHEGLALDVRQDGDGRAVVSVNGELDIATIGAFHDAVEDVLDDGVWEVVLDLTGLEFCDCTGVGGLVAIANEADARGSRLVLACPSRQLVRILFLTRLDDRIPILTGATR